MGHQESFTGPVVREVNNYTYQLHRHQRAFLAPFPGSVALLVSEAGKETFILLLLFLFFAVATLSPYGPL